jgi:hypothetical protein
LLLARPYDTIQRLLLDVPEEKGGARMVLVHSGPPDEAAEGGTMAKTPGAETKP